MTAMPEEDSKRTLHRALVDRVLNGDGRASAEERARAFRNEGSALAGKVVASPAQITDADFAAAKAAGYTDDQLFELVICAAVGQSDRLYEAGLAALAEAERPEAERPEAERPVAERPGAEPAAETERPDDAS
jgi:hypothetical protein